jgi:hypothetical protein
MEVTRTSHTHDRHLPCRCGSADGQGAPFKYRSSRILRDRGAWVAYVGGGPRRAAAASGLGLQQIDAVAGKGMQFFWHIWDQIL